MSAMLLATILVPLGGAAAALLAGPRARASALVTSLCVLAMAAVLVVKYPAGTPDFAAVDIPWSVGATGVTLRFSLALDGVSLWFYALTALLSVVAVLAGWDAIRENAPTYYALLLVLEAGMLGVFVARDILLFYVFFEFTLLPLFFLVGIWGSEDRRRAAVKFFLFTLAGSVLTFLGILTIVLWDAHHMAAGATTFSIPQLAADLAAWPMAPKLQIVVFVALFAGFAVKTPLFPLHTWLPLAHVQAPTAGSILLAGVLLKIGTYGFLRFALPMTPEGVAACMPWLLALSVVGIVYGALVALAQSDIKRLIAYSSVSHLGFCMLGVFALNRVGLAGGTLQMINHGLSTGGLFAMVGMLYERYHSRRIDDFGGLAQRTPRLAAFFVILTLSSIGLPGLNGFAGEFLLLAGMFQRGWGDAPAAWAFAFRAMSVVAVSGVVLGAWYMLALVQRVFFGPLREPAVDGHGPEATPGGSHDAAHIRDLGFRETSLLGVLIVFIVWIGVQPSLFLDRMTPSLDALTDPAISAAEWRIDSKGGPSTIAAGKTATDGRVPQALPARVPLALPVLRGVPGPSTALAEPVAHVRSPGLANALGGKEATGVE